MSSTFPCAWNSRMSVVRLRFPTSSPRCLFHNGSNAGASAAHATKDPRQEALAHNMFVSKMKPPPRGPVIADALYMEVTYDGLKREVRFEFHAS